MELLKEFQVIPGVGPNIAQDLMDLGYKSVEDLRCENPGTMYKDLMFLRGTHIDKCVLYVFRCAVYYASNSNPNPVLLKWWNWKDNKKWSEL